MAIYLTDKEHRKIMAIPIPARDKLWDEALKLRMGKIVNVCSLNKEQYVDCARYILDQYYH